ncbi:MAG: TadE/TadG family type IV pilus assembly protein [Parvularculaceae bacterium]
MIRQSALSRLVRFLRSSSGIAAIEFAFIAPVMILLFFGVVEGSNAFSVSRRVSLAVNTLADLTSQETQLTADQAGDLFTGVEQIVGQGDIAADIAIVSLIFDPDTDTVVVHWSRDNAGGQPYAPGTEYDGLTDATLLDESSSLIVGEISYTYESALTRHLLSPIDFEKSASRWPRRSARVQFCTSPGVCTS